MGTVCTKHGSQRRASALPEDLSQPRGLELLVPLTQARRASAQPEIITTAAGDGDCTPQVSLWSFVVFSGLGHKHQSGIQTSFVLVIICSMSNLSFAVTPFSLKKQQTKVLVIAVVF